MEHWWKSVKKKFGNGFTLMIVPNSPQNVKSFGLPFLVVLVLLAIIGVNIYVFCMFTTQIFQISGFQQDLSRREQTISQLEHEQSKIRPTLNRSYQILGEINQLKTEREKILRIWQSIQKK